MGSRTCLSIIVVVVVLCLCARRDQDTSPGVYNLDFRQRSFCTLSLAP